MPKIRLVKNRKHVQIEFPADIPHPEGRRGGRGTSLHLQRNKVRDVTVEELDYLLREEPDVYACLQVMPAPTVSKRTARRLAAAALPEKPAAKPEKPTKTKRGKKPA